MKTGYDSVASSVAEWRSIVPETTPQVIGSYRNGQFANDAVAEQAFPHALHISYDVNGSRPDADILDIEPEDARPAAAPGWSRLYKGRLPHPGLYTSASSIADVVTAMLDAGYKRDQFLIQSAHYTNEAHICGPHTCGFPQSDATQYADKGTLGQNTDRSIFADYFFGPVAPPKPDMHYDWFPLTSFLIFGNRYSERATVLEYDKLRATQTPKLHPNRARLVVLRARLRLLAGRVDRVATHPLGKNGKPTWGLYERGWRYQQLIHRAQGQRFI